MRIVSLLPGATEILCALGLRGQLVAISHECDYPADVLKLPRVSSTLLSSEQESATIDKLVSDANKNGEPLNLLDLPLLQTLDADLVVSQSLCDVCAIDANAIEQVIPSSGNGPSIVSLSGADFAGLLNDIRAIGQITQTSQLAEQLCTDLSTRWHDEPCDSAIGTPSVLFVEWSDPGYYAGHWVPQMISRAGGCDIFGVAGERSGVFNWPHAQEKAPDVIVFGCCGFDLQRNVQIAEDFAATPMGSVMAAGAGGGLWAVDSNSYFSRPGPRVVDGMLALASLFRGRETKGVSARVLA